MVPTFSVDSGALVFKRVAGNSRQWTAQPCGRYGTVALVLAAVALGAMPAAQAQVRRNGNIYDFTSHQPTQNGVVNRERKEGDAPPPAQARSEQRTVDQLDQKLLHQEQTDPPAAAAPR